MPVKAQSNGTANRIADSAEEKREVLIAPPNMQTAEFTIVGTAPYVQEKFSEKNRQQMKDAQQAGSTGKKGKKQKPKDFKECYQQAQYKGRAPGKKATWNGIPAGAFRTAMIDACRLVGFQMTKGKQMVFVESDGFDVDSGTPLVKFSKGKPRQVEHVLNNDNGGADIRVRPMWDPGWEIKLRIRFDADWFTLDDVASLLVRVGLQVGIGAGRHFSRKCAGCGWGTFEVKS